MKSKVIGLVSAVLLIVSTWLPYAAKFGIGYNLMNNPNGKGIGIFTIVIGILCAAFIAMDKKGTKIAAIVISGLFFLLTVMILVGVLIEPRPSVSLAIGAFLIPISCVGIIVGAIMGLKATKTPALT